MSSPVSPKDQIAFITAPLIQKQFFSRFFRTNGIDFDKTDAETTLSRNAQLWERTQQLNRHDNKCYDNLVYDLSVIDIIGQDSRQAAEFFSEMATHQELYDAFTFADEFGDRKQYRRNARNVAAWLYLQTYSPDGAIKHAANIMWENIKAKVAILHQESKTYTYFTTEDIVCPEDLEKLFCDKYRNLRIEETGNKRYPARCMIDKPSGGIRLSVTSGKDPTMTIQTSESQAGDTPPKDDDLGEEPFKLGFDRNAESFCIYIYPLCQYFRIKFLRHEQRAKQVAKILAEICGFKISDNRGKKYYLQAFQSRDVLDTLSIKSLDPRHPNRVWVSALGVERTDDKGNRISKNIEVEFPYDKSKTIYDNIEAAYANTAKCQISNIFSIQLSFMLYDFHMHNGQRLFHDEPFVKTVTIKPGHCNFNNSFKDVHQEIKTLVDDCLKNAGLVPLNKDAYNLLIDKVQPK